MSFYNNPFMNSMKTPQQYQQELNQQMQQYQQMYNQNQQQNINANANNLNGYDGYIKYINNYNDVENAQVPMNGTPVLFISNDGNIAWCKKFVNGQNYCDVYNLAKSQNKPINQESKNDLNTILDRLATIESKLNIDNASKDNPFKELKQNE